MIKVCKKFFELKSIHDSDTLFNVESIVCFIFSISYTVPEILKRKLKENTKKMVLQKTLCLTEYHLFCS